MNENDNTNKKLSVAIYLRLSDEDRNKTTSTDDSESIKNQRNLLMNEISKHNDWQFYDEYCDEDLSGAGTYRPEFERLIEDAENKKIDVILCKSQSRFSRDMEVIEKYLHNKFIEWNIRFLSFTDNADTNNIGNKKSRQINGLVNEWYLEDLSNNIKSAFEVKMKNGEFISPFAPYGYVINPKNNNELIVDDDVKNNIIEIFNLYLNGLGYGSIAKLFNERKIPCPSHYKHIKGFKLNVISSRNIENIKWSHNAIKTILINEVYIGSLIQGKRTTVSYKNKKTVKRSKNLWIRVDNAHEPIIDIETWNCVQIKMKKRQRVLKKNGMIHTFSHKVYCSACGHYLKKNSTKEHEYLICTSNKNGYDECPNKYSIRYDLLEKIVLKEINKIFKKYYDKKELLDNNNNLISNYHNIINNLMKEKNQLIKKEKDNDNYLKTLYKDRVKGVITAKEFKILRCEQDNTNKYGKQIKKISDKISKIKVNINKDCNYLIKKYKKIKKLNAIIVNEFIDNIEIGSLNKIMKERNITIKWKFNI